MEKIRILWADDEIDMLKAHVIFLEQKGYEVVSTNNGNEALELIRTEAFDIIFLDENMPGLTGLETLAEINNLKPGIPVVMITKSEEESIMEDAIGGNISDYLIKPVKPNQILLTLKKNLEKRELISQKTTMAYQQAFREIGMEISTSLDLNGWMELYRRIVNWELRLQQTREEGMLEVVRMQKEEINNIFSRYYEDNYPLWLKGKAQEKPVLSHTLIREKLFPLLDKESQLFLIVIDNLRYDQWKTIQPVIDEFYRVEKDEMYCSILPTTTQFARNALFAGLMPSEIEKKYPTWWINEWDEGTKNQYEEQLLGELLKRFGKNIKFSFNKILNLSAGTRLVDNLPNLLVNQLNVVVYNFVDTLSHARTEMEIIKELANDEAAYRSLTLSWFEHSPLHDIIRFLAEKRIPVVITTDHGSIRVQNAVKVVGDRETNVNLRFKAGKNLNFNKKECFHIRNPEDIFLPRQKVTTSYIFARGNDFFAYPNNFNYYSNYYRNTFQHGGISLEEILVPFVFLKPKV